MKDFSLIKEQIQEKLKLQDILVPTPVQSEVIPRILDGENVLFQSETGTGKTFAYLLPLLNKIDEKKIGVQILITAPTFELCSQINAACKSVCDYKTVLLIGGVPLKRQIENLKASPFIAIGTPARLVELIRLKKLKTEKIFAAVFDETDRLIKKELYDSTSELRNVLPQGTQIVSCSATLDKKTKIFFADSKNVVMPEEDILKKKITHWAIFAERRDKIETLRKFLTAENPVKALIFTSRTDQIENIRSKLAFRGIKCAVLFSKSDKVERKKAIDNFRSGKEKYLITSDLSSRGLDIMNISHVIQMDLPEDEDFFVHRSGRTGRAGKSGINVVIGDEVEMRRYAALEKKLGLTVYPKEIYGGKVLDCGFESEEEK